MVSYVMPYPILITHKGVTLGDEVLEKWIVRARLSQTGLVLYEKV